MSRLGKRTRSALTGLVAVSALASSAVLLPQFAEANLSTAQATTALNVRQDPNTSARILGVLSAGEQVERRGDPRGEWTPVRYRGQDAWVFSAYIAFGDLGAAPGTATATTVVNVRSGSSTLSPVIGCCASASRSLSPVQPRAAGCRSATGGVRATSTPRT